jgi:hypothetical protein
VIGVQHRGSCEHAAIYLESGLWANGRLWQNYLTLLGDRVEDALARIRYALDALEVTIEMLSRLERPTVL